MTKSKETSPSSKICEAIVEGMQENKAQDIVVLDLRKIPNTVTDFFVICTGESSTQMDGISSAVVRYTRKHLQEKPWHTEGLGSREWVLIDYVSVVAHVFYKETRQHYDLEELWSDAEKIIIPN